MAERHLKIVRLLEPELCMDCRFAKIAHVENDRGEFQRMIHCRRLDCDNWNVVDAELARSMQFEE